MCGIAVLVLKDKSLEPVDLCALTIETSAMAHVPLAGTDWIAGKGGF